MKKVIKNLEEMEKFAESIANKIYSGKLAGTGKAIVFGLYGDLGSGKTTFTKSFISAFGVKQTVTSPTFVIEKIYKIPKQNKKVGRATPNFLGFEHIIHIDAYRLNSGEEMKDLGWDKISDDSQNLILIEWPEKIADVLPENMKKIEFKFINEDQREVKY